jgi:hypothetical protein
VENGTGNGADIGEMTRGIPALLETWDMGGTERQGTRTADGAMQKGGIKLQPITENKRFRHGIIYYR